MPNKISQPGATATINPTDVDSSTAPASKGDDQKKLKALVERRHPQYADFVSHWEFLEQTYDGGREWFNEKNIFKYVKEGPEEYRDRVGRCYRFNHTREVVDLLNKYLFKQHITRNDKDAPESVKRFWERATKHGLGIRDFMRQASKRASILGRIAVVVDNPPVAGEVLSKADEKKLDVRSYAYIVGPKQLLDYAKDEQGELIWILILETFRDDADPINSSGRVKPRYRLWTRSEWILLEEEEVKGKKIVKVVDRDQHGLGEVPVILHDHIISDEEYVSQALVDDIAYLDRAVANYLSNLDAIIQDQTYSQLAMPAQNVLPGDDNYNTLMKMGTSRIFLYDGEAGGNKPEFISPDPKQAGVILAVIGKIINEIYHTVGMAGERTKEDNATGIDNSSGVAKAYDFERVNALLQAKADSLEALENRIVRLVAKWNGEEARVDVKGLVSYPNNFDTRSLYDEFDIAGRLMLVQAPDALRRQQMETLMDKLFPQLAKDLKAKMLAELKSWPVDPVEMAADMAKATASAVPKAEKDKKQGQNNKPAEKSKTAPGNK